MLHICEAKWHALCVLQVSQCHRYTMIFFRPTEDNGVKIVAVDLQLMAPISGVIQIHGDITKVGLVPVIRQFNWLTISL